MKLKNKSVLAGLGILLLIMGVINSCSREFRTLSVELEIQELVCLDSQHLLEGRILSLRGIKAVTANIQTQKVLIRYHEKNLSESEIRSNLLDIGFTVDGVSGNPVARQRLPSCCFQRN